MLPAVLVDFSHLLPPKCGSVFRGLTYGTHFGIVQLAAMTRLTAFGVSVGQYRMNLAHLERRHHHHHHSADELLMMNIMTTRSALGQQSC